jgi:YVTN family beta-propeller protein
MTHTNGRGTRLYSLATVAFLIPLFIGIESARADAQTTAYVANTNANVVTVIDTAANTIIGVIPVGASPAHVALSKDGARAYVTNTGSNTVSVIDTSLREVIGTVDVADQPSTIAVTPSGDLVYVLGAAGVVQAIDTKTNAIVASVPVGGVGRLAITPDGSRVYVAAGAVTVIDTATNEVLASFVPEVAAAPDVFNFSVAIAISPDGAHAYAAVHTWFYKWTGFSAGGGIAVIDTATNTVTDRVELWSQPGSIAVTPDGSRVYAGIQSFWADTLYGAAFLPGRTIIEVDTATKAMVGWADLGTEGANWSDQHTPADVVVSPDRTAVYVSIPRISSVAAVDTASNEMTTVLPVGGGPSGLAIAADPSITPKAYSIEAVNDSAAAPLPAVAGIAVANVLANDRIGHANAAIGNVVLSFVSSTNAGVTLDEATGAVWIADGTDVGGHSLTYRICETGNVANCGEAVAAVNVRPPFVLDATDDDATSFAGARAGVNVLANDTLDGGPAAGSVAVSIVSADAGVTLDAASGSIVVAAGTPTGARTIVYRACEITSPANCDEATVRVTVVAREIRAESDGATSPRTGGRAIASVFANDTLDGTAVTSARVTSALVSGDDGLTFDALSGSITVAAGAVPGAHTLVYRICETASPNNCSDGTATITVNPYVVNAVGEAARASSKTANRPIPNVLGNDTLGGEAATLANVRLSLVSQSPSSKSIRLNLADGSVDVLGKTSGGIYSLVYQICEIASPSNCARATVTLDVSGK